MFTHRPQVLEQCPRRVDSGSHPTICPSGCPRGVDTAMEPRFEAVSTPRGWPRTRKSTSLLAPRVQRIATPRRQPPPNLLLRLSTRRGHCFKPGFHGSVHAAWTARRANDGPSTEAPPGATPAREQSMQSLKQRREEQRPIVVRGSQIAARIRARRSQACAPAITVCKEQARFARSRQRTLPRPHEPAASRISCGIKATAEASVYIYKDARIACVSANFSAR